MNLFWKDAMAMFFGMFFGAMLAHSAGCYWLVGVLAGGGIGYLSRLIQEPERVVWAARTAWQKTVSWEPDKEWWRLFLATNFYATMFSGGAASPLAGLVGICVVAQITLITLIPAIVGYLVGVALALLFALVIAILFFLLDIETTEELKRHFRQRKDLAWRYNAVTIYYRLLIWTVFGIKTILGFVKSFVILVHSERFTACGAYSIIGALGIYIYIPYQPALMAIVAVAGALLGAILRRVVLRILEPSSA